MTWSPPTSVAASLTGPGQITVTWTNPGGTDWNDIWRVRRGQSGRGVCVASVIPAAATWTDTAAPLGQELRYLVYAGDGPRHDIDWSTTEAWSGYVLTTVVQATGLTAKRVGADVVLTWVNGSADVTTGAVIRGSTDGGSSWSTLASPTGAGMVTWTHASASQASAWTYGVQLVAGAVSGAWSASSNTVAVVGAPNAPTGLAVGGGTVFDPAAASVWSWVHNPADTTDQSAYEVQYRIGAGGWTSTGKVTSTPAARTFAAATFTAGTLYEWQARTYGLHASASPWSASASVSTSTTPVAGISTTSPYGSSTLTVTGSYYQAESSAAAQARWTVSGTGGLIESATVPIVAGVIENTFAAPVANGVTYTVTLQVQSAAGLWSNVASADLAVSFAAPPAPTVTLTYLPTTGSVSVAYEVAAGTPAATSVEVWRGTTLLASGLPTTGTVTDPIPPLLPSVGYTVVSISALPSSAATTATVATLTEMARVWLNGGVGMLTAVGIEWDPRVRVSSGLDRATVAYAGRVSPVEYSGAAVDKSVSVSGVVATVAEVDALEALATTAGPACYRDPDGRRLFVALLDVDYPAGVGARPYVPVSVSARQVDYAE